LNRYVGNWLQLWVAAYGGERAVGVYEDTNGVGELPADGNHNGNSVGHNGNHNYASTSEVHASVTTSIHKFCLRCIPSFDVLVV